MSANRQFDRAFGTDTALEHGLAELDVAKEDRVDANDYECMHAGTLLRILRGLAIDLSAYQFVDLGSGKGKTLLVAATLPFATIVGVELSQQLHLTAEANLLRCVPSRSVPNRNVRSVHADALQYEGLHDDVVVFMMNPFGASVMAGVVAKLDGHFADRARRGIVVYVNPVEREVVASSRTLETVFSARRLAVFATPSAGLRSEQLRHTWGRRFDRWSVSRARIRPLPRPIESGP